MKKNVFGTCRLCHQERKLTFEHIPPRSTFNKTTRYQTVSFIDVMKAKNPLEDKIRGKLNQGGVGVHAFCSECNNFLGRKYVKAYRLWAGAGAFALHPGNFTSCEYEVFKAKPNEILKHIASMFLAINEPWYGEANSELRDFVLDPDCIDLNPKYRFFTYLKRPGQIRYLPFMISGNISSGKTTQVSELAFTPFGFVLTYDDPQERKGLVEITDFKKFIPGKFVNIDLKINVFETNLPIPLDYRNSEKVKSDLKNKS